MKSIPFFDTEVHFKTKKIQDIGGVKNDGSIFHSPSVNEFATFVDGADYLCGHNIIHHDLVYLSKYSAFGNCLILFENCIDTLHFSPLLFPTHPYHRLLKDDKLQTEECNNPVNDSRKAQDLFHDELQAFSNLESELQEV